MLDSQTTDIWHYQRVPRIVRGRAVTHP